MYVDEMRDTLNWRSLDAPMPSYLLEAKRRRVRLTVEEMCWASRREGSLPSGELTRLYESLDGVGANRLLDGGLTYSAIQGFAPAQLDTYVHRLLPLVAAENAAQQRNDYRPTVSCWTADCAEYFPAETEKGTQDFERLDEWDASARLRSPRLSNGQVVDFESPWVRRDEPRSGVLNGPFIPHTPAEKECIIEKLNATLDLLQRTCPGAFKLVTEFTKTIRVRKRNEDGHGSEQVPAEIGTIRLSNLHHPDVNEILSAESLIHESIHNFLSIYEWLITPFSLQYDFDSRARPISPWSENPIPHPSFTHAICVYYGLWNFLDQLEPLVQDRVKQQVRGRLFACAAGFLQGPHVSHYIDVIGRTHPQIAAMFDAMQVDVVNASSGLFFLNGRSLCEQFKERILLT